MTWKRVWFCEACRREFPEHAAQHVCSPEASKAPAQDETRQQCKAPRWPGPKTSGKGWSPVCLLDAGHTGPHKDWRGEFKSAPQPTPSADTCPEGCVNGMVHSADLEGKPYNASETSWWVPCPLGCKEKP